METEDDEFELDTSAMFTSCNCDHRLRKRDYELRQHFLEAHIETKERLIKSLELIIDEQEGEISSLKKQLDEVAPDRAGDQRNNKKVLKGISYLSLDFGHLSNEILELKELLRESQMESRRLKIRGTQQQYSTIPILVDSTCQTEPDAPQTENIASSCSSISSGASTPIIPLDPPQLIISPVTECLSSTVEVAELRKELSILMQEKEKLKDYYQQQVNDAFEEVRSYLLSLIPRYISKLTQRYEEEVRLRKALHDTLVELRGNIRVFCRIRPSSMAVKNAVLLQDTLDKDSVMAQLDSGGRRFLFDKVFSEMATQVDIYLEVSPLIRSCLDGKNVSIFAYGHTGSGKTYSMDGPDENPGIGQRALIEIFETLSDSSDHTDYEIFVSMIEIYNEKIRDLLGNDSGSEKPQLRMDVDGRQEVRGIVRRPVDSLQAVNEILQEGRRNRSVATTALNVNSSRSHAVVMVTVNMRDLTSGTRSTGRLNLIDLAGSERVAKSQATGPQLKEAQFINKSLSELGNVVSALRRQQSHIPFRNCLLTRVLQDSLNGDSKTLMIVQVAAEPSEFQESLSSLNFAEKVGNITRPAVAPVKNKEGARKKLERRMTMEQ